MPEDLWRPTGDYDDPSSRLAVVVWVAGKIHHLEAIAVQYDHDIQVAAHHWGEAYIEAVEHATAPDGPYHTVEIRGREYFLVMTPGS